MTSLEREYRTDNRVPGAPVAIADEPYETRRSTYDNVNRVIDRNAPAFEGRDVVAAGLATLMMLAPLAAYAVGWGA